MHKCKLERPSHPTTLMLWLLGIGQWLQLIPNVVQYENWTTVTGDVFLLDAATRGDLLKKGHALKPLAGGTISQLVVHNVEGRGDLTAVSDPRKGGVPAGY